MINSCFFIGTIGILICATCVYSLSYPKNNIIFKNKNNCMSMLLPFSQKIIYLNSGKEINIYKNYNNADVFIFKFNNSDSVSVKVTDDICGLDIFMETNILNGLDILDKCEITTVTKKELELLYKDLLDKKLIKISPGGLYGFYDAGICSIIKKNYNLNNYIFSGASAGAWNSLFMSYKNDIDKLISNILDIDINFNSIKDLQKMLKQKILESHSTEEFDLKKVFISVCVFDNYQFKNHIYTDFVDLSDAIDCCIASSNIPFVTGNLIHKYRNKITFDGGFLKHQTFIFKKPNFEINHAIWGRNRFFTSLFDKTNANIQKTYSEGISDTNLNISLLDKEFIDV
jgi:hypothetical protein